MRMNYEEYIESSLWKKLRKKAYELANHKCELCEKKASAVHHIQYPKNYRMGVRFGEKERGRLTQLFFRYAGSGKIIKLNLQAYKESITRYNILKEEEALTKSSSVF